MMNSKLSCNNYSQIIMITINDLYSSSLVNDGVLNFSMNRYESERSNGKMHVIHIPAFLCLQYASKNKQVDKGNNCHHPL